jgi:EmrB/QacA subfamily drug resistance transporter
MAADVGTAEESKTTAHWHIPILVILIGGFMSTLDSSIVNVAISAMMKDFQVTTSQIQWVVTVYLLTLGVVVPASGWLADYLGLKRLYIYALIVFTIGSALCSLAWDENVLIAARAVQAVGGGMIMPTIMSIVFKLVPKEQIGAAMGSFGIILIVAPALGPTIGGYLVEYVDWRWIFTMNLPIGIAGIFLASVILQEFPHGQAGKFDGGGCLASSVSLFCLLLALSQGQDWGWSSFPVVMLFYASFCLMALFVIHELTTANPLLDLRIFKIPSFCFGNLMLAVVTVGMYGGLFYVPLFLQSIRGLGALEVGLMMLPPALVTAVMMPISGRIYDRLGAFLPVSVGVLILSYSTYLFVDIGMDTSLATITQWNMIRSLGMGLAMMPIQTSLMSVLPTEQVGRGSAITNIISRVASSLGLAVLTIMLNSKLAYHTDYLKWTVSQDGLSDLIASGVADQDAIMALLTANIAKTAFVRALDEMFLVTAAITFSALLFMFFLPRKKAQNAKPITSAE